MADDTGVILVFSSDGEQLHRLDGHKLGVWCLAATKTKLVSGSEDKTIRVWNLTTGLCTHVFRGHQGVVRCLQIVRPEPALEKEPHLPPDQQHPPQPLRPLIVSGSRDGTVRVWVLPRISESEYGQSHTDAPPPDPDPAANPYHLYHLTGHNGPVRCLAADRKIVLSGGEDCTVRVYDIKASKLLHVLRGHTAKITNVIINVYHRSWYSTSMDGRLRIYDSKNGDCLVDLSQHSAGITFLFTTTCRVVTGGEDGYAFSHGTRFRELLTVYHSGDGEFLCDLKGDDYKVLTVTETSAKFWDMRGGTVTRTLLQCVGREKLSHVAYEQKQCALTHKNAHGYNMLTIIDFKAPDEPQRWRGFGNPYQDSDDEAHP